MSCEEVLVSRSEETLVFPATNALCPIWVAFEALLPSYSPSIATGPYPYCSEAFMFVNGLRASHICRSQSSLLMNEVK